MSYVTLVAKIDDPQLRFEGLFAPYDLRIIYSDHEEALIGSGSFSYARQIDIFRYPGVPNPAAIVGRHCEIAGGSVVLAGGEHHNERAVNITFQRFVDIAAATPQLRSVFGAHSKGMVRIGNAVVLSRNVVVRSGVSIGDGAVIGANSLVTRDIPPFAIAAGNPAKVVRMRFSDEIISELMDLRWWDLEIPWIFKNAEILSEINALSFINRLNSAKPPYRSDLSRFVLDASATSDGKRSFKVIGVDELGKFFAIQDCPENVKRYVSQLALPSGEKINFVKNIFNAD